MFRRVLLTNYIITVINASIIYAFVMKVNVKNVGFAVLLLFVGGFLSQ